MPGPSGASCRASTAGATNMGAGGGGRTTTPGGTCQGANGGSGIVLIRYKFQ